MFYYIIILLPQFYRVTAKDLSLEVVII